jgi:hypothetical protein
MGHPREAETLGAFFWFEQIQQNLQLLCLTFDNRIIYLRNGMVRLLGVLKKDVNPSISYYVLRRKKAKSPSLHQKKVTPLEVRISHLVTLDKSSASINIS